MSPLCSLLCTSPSSPPPAMTQSLFRAADLIIFIPLHHNHFCSLPIPCKTEHSESPWLIPLCILFIFVSSTHGRFQNFAKGHSIHTLEPRGVSKEKTFFHEFHCETCQVPRTVYKAGWSSCFWSCAPLTRTSLPGCSVTHSLKRRHWCYTVLQHLPLHTP